MSEILAGAALFSVPREDTDVYVHVMLALDRAYVAMVREEIRIAKEREARKNRMRRGK